MRSDGAVRDEGSLRRNVIARVDAYKLSIPLTRPYKLAFGPVTHYDTILVVIEGDEGERGFGEATLLTGYTDETIIESWTRARELAEMMPGLDFEDASRRLRELGHSAPFTATAFHTALDMARAHPMLSRTEAARVPVLGLLQGEATGELRDAFDALLSAGYRTVKVKIGFDVDADLRLLSRVQSVVDGRAAIRVDANQGYTAEQAIDVVRGVDPAGIELFEQPCAAGDWTAHRAVAEIAATNGLPLMLDESIYDESDIDRAAREHACAYLKVKLMKFIGIDPLVSAISRIREKGMKPVLGNGVACDVSCWMEACVAAHHIDNAGEMNGFLKARRMLFATPLVLDRGDIVLTPGVPELDMQAVNAYAQDRISRHEGHRGWRARS
jgi:L-alanine-DL-glutamate epimerase-like enolase superfamily enzyme